MVHFLMKGGQANKHRRAFVSRREPTAGDARAPVKIGDTARRSPEIRC